MGIEEIELEIQETSRSAMEKENALQASTNILVSEAQELTNEMVSILEGAREGLKKTINLVNEMSGACLPA